MGANAHPGEAAPGILSRKGSVNMVQLTDLQSGTHVWVNMRLVATMRRITSGVRIYTVLLFGDDREVFVTETPEEIVLADFRRHM